MRKNGALTAFARGVVRSYSQIFFSENDGLAIPLAAVSFLDFSAGLCGLLSVISANMAASLLKLNNLSLTKGFYGFNSLLVGLGLGYYFKLSPILIVIAILSGFLTLLITITIQGILDKYYLPSLSLPFVFAVWIVLSSVGELNGTVINQSGAYVLNKLFMIGGEPLVRLHQWWISNITSDFLNSYFLSLGAIFFQFNVFAGLIIAIALFFYSRITFVLSLLGFSVAWVAYLFFGMDLNQIGYSFIGFNFILGAIAIGGYFYIPSLYSYVWAIAMTPVIALAAAGISGLIKPLHLILVSLPFNIVVITFIYALRFRTSASHFREVVIQEGIPERNLYSFRSFTSRFPNFGWMRIKLPFFGEWLVDQGHEGDFTHKGDWAQAWDFVITDRNKLRYRNKGTELVDHYCFDQPVLAPADGSVVMTEDGIDDNKTGEVNIDKNWGNTIIIKHAEGLFTKLSHLRKGSLTVKIGDNVISGQRIGRVGNSGRSPYPHLHFQVQQTPYIGSKTMKYPLFAFLDNGKSIETFNYPGMGHLVSAVEAHGMLKKAFSLFPGTKLKWESKSPKGVEKIEWDLQTTVWNKSFIFCKSTNSSAYFDNDGIHFTFTHFEGDRSSLLYSFYLAAFRLPLVYIDGNLTVDSVPANHTFKGIRLFLHDFTAPFFIYLKAQFETKMTISGSEFDPDNIEYSSVITGFSFNKMIWSKNFRLSVNKNNSLKLVDSYSSIEAKCEPY